MENVNCPNCGAVIEADKNACPYCGTSYFDFTNIDLSKRKPVILKMKHGDQTVVTKAVLTSASLDCYMSDLSFHAYGDDFYSTIPHYEIRITFESA